MLAIAPPMRFPVDEEDIDHVATAQLCVYIILLFRNWFG
jgi:hypothetical protein